MSYVNYIDLIDSLLDQRLVDPGSTVIYYVGVCGPKIIVYRFQCFSIYRGNWGD